MAVYQTEDFLQTKRTGGQMRAWAVLVECVPHLAPPKLAPVRPTLRMSMDQDMGTWKRVRLFYGSAA